MEILIYNTKEGTAIIKQGINIHKTPITPEIQELINKHTKKQENKQKQENKETKTKQKNNKTNKKQDKNTKKQQEN